MKFGSYWQGDWPWDSHMGVGLRLTGFPRNVDEFRQFLYGMSCNPIAVERIINELREKGVKLTTVQPSFNFAYLGDEFSRLGVKMEVVAPAQPEQLNDSTIDVAALLLATGGSLPSSLNEDQAREALRRASETGMLEKEKLGPYKDIF